MSKIEQYRSAIKNFRERLDEEFAESWVRLYDLLIKCLHHGIDKGELIHFFYRGHTNPQRILIESMHKGEFMNQTADQAYEFLVKLAENSQNWRSIRKDLERDETGIQKLGMYNNKQNPELKNVMISLVQGVENLNKKIGSMSVMSCQPTPQQHEPTLRSMTELHHICVMR